MSLRSDRLGSMAADQTNGNQKVKEKYFDSKVQDSLELEPGAVQYFWTPDTYLK